ncbi:MAG: hypothetical protein ACRD4G_20040, partial [Bryobacteraceae bacterium]
MGFEPKFDYPPFNSRVCTRTSSPYRQGGLRSKVNPKEEFLPTATAPNKINRATLLAPADLAGFLEFADGCDRTQA